MRVIDCQQGSAEWLHERIGRITASRICEAMSRYKDPKRSHTDTAERFGYKEDLVSERITGETTENFVSPEMKWGRLYEPDARTAYEIEKDVLTQQAGFIIHPTMDFAGASPDSIVGDGGLEIKCPKNKTHNRWRRDGVVPEDHRDQCLWNMACAETTWWDFMSYDPRAAHRGLDTFIIRMERDDKRIAHLEAEVVRVNDEVSEMVEWLLARSKGKPQPKFQLDTRSAFEQALAAVEGEIVP